MIFCRAHQRDQIGSYVPFYRDAVQQVRWCCFPVHGLRLWSGKMQIMTVFPYYFSFPWSTFPMVFCRRGQLNVQAVKPAVRCSENDRWLPQWPPARQWYLRWVNRSDSRKGLGCSFLPPPSTLKSHSQLCFKKSPTLFPSKMWPNIFGQRNCRRMWQIGFFVCFWPRSRHVRMSFSTVFSSVPSTGNGDCRNSQLSWRRWTKLRRSSQPSWKLPRRKFWQFLFYDYDLIIQKIA